MIKRVTEEAGSEAANENDILLFEAVCTENDPWTHDKVHRLYNGSPDTMGPFVYDR